MFNQYLPGFRVPPDAFLRPSAIMVALGLVAGRRAGVAGDAPADRRSAAARVSTRMSFRSAFNQLVAVTAMNLRNLPARLGTSLVAVVGIGGVVAVLVSLLSMGEGFRAALDLSGRDDVAMILRGGSADELSSSFTREEFNVIVLAPGIARDERGPVASGELYTIVDLPMRSTGTAANVPFRGVGERAVELRENFRIVAGRMFQPGKNEVIVGRGVFAQFGNVDLGREVHWGSQTWRVVGVFEAGGSVSESEVWTDLVVLRGVYRRGNSVQIVRAQLTSPAALQTRQGCAGARSAGQRLRAQRAGSSTRTSRASCWR